MIFDSAWKAIFNPGAAADFFRATPLIPFQNAATGYSEINAWWLAEISRLIYKKGPEEDKGGPHGITRNEILRTVGLRERRFFDSGKVQCAIVTRDGEPRFSVLVFRGTKGKLNTWLSNLSASQSRWPGGGKVHGGFMHLFEEIWRIVERDLSSLCGPLYFTGHSLGAAMATLAAAVRRPTALYTFGSPRVGNPAFVASLDHVKAYRVVNRLDIVATMPPSLLTLEFSHVGEPHFLAPSMDNPFGPLAGDRAPGGEEQPAGVRVTHRIVPPRFLLHHAPVNYCHPYLADGPR